MDFKLLSVVQSDMSAFKRDMQEAFQKGFEDVYGKTEEMILPEKDIDSIFEPEIQRTENGWEIYYRIPYFFVRQLFPQFVVTPGDTIRANCFACSDLSQPHYYLSWNPITEEPFTFHHSRCFGSMVFE